MYDLESQFLNVHDARWVSEMGLPIELSKCPELLTNRVDKTHANYGKKS